MIILVDFEGCLDRCPCLATVLRSVLGHLGCQLSGHFAIALRPHFLVEFLLRWSSRQLQVQFDMIY